MSLAGGFQAVAARYGKTVSIERDGVSLGAGRAILRPVLHSQREFTPTELGVARWEEVLCLGEAALPLGERTGREILRQGEKRYDIVNAYPVEAGEEIIFWQAALRRREESL